MRTINVEAVAAAIKIPVEKWEGNCFAIATALVESGLIEGKAVFGHYRGPVSSEGTWGNRKGHPFIQHGWVVMKGGLIVDPTRWSFEGVDPYIWVGEPSDEYDREGNIWAEAMLRPPPSYDPNGRMTEVEFKEPERSMVNMLLGHRPNRPYTLDQIFWLGNLPTTVLRKYAKGTYQTLKEYDFSVFVPSDRWDSVMEEPQ